MFLEWTPQKKNSQFFLYSIIPTQTPWAEHGLQNKQLATLLNDLTEKLDTRSISEINKSN